MYALWAIVAGGEGPSTPLPDGLAGGFTVVNELFQLLKHNEGHYNGWVVVLEKGCVDEAGNSIDGGFKWEKKCTKLEAILD